MFWSGISALIISVCLFLISGGFLSDKEKDFPAGFLSFLIFGIVAMATGTFLLYYSATGKISYPKFKETATIYSVCGQVQTSRGVVAVVENGDKEVFALWDSYEGGPEGLPPETKFARIARDEKHNKYLEPVTAP